MSTATTALLDADVAPADRVIAGDERVDGVRDSIEQRCFTLLARQQPVATDLRTTTAAMRIVSDLERMGDLAAHVAKLARIFGPRSSGRFAGRLQRLVVEASGPTLQRLP